jgi:D-alanyl-D-alanine carboxypeptidase (penicillin-binding protein 5/6)
MGEFILPDLYFMTHTSVDMSAEAFGIIKNALKIMKLAWWLYFFTVVFGSIGFVGYLYTNHPDIIQRNLSIHAPLPSFLAYPTNNQVSTLDLWTPHIDIAMASSKKTPQLSASSALVFDTTTEKTLFSLHPLDKHPMASLTKVMTSVIALENKKADDKYVVRKQSLVGEDSMGLSENETLTLEDLLYGLLLPSGNDAAEVLADNFSGGRTAFITAMNEKAKALGLSNTHFTNPSGLEGDGNQYTTAYDLLVVTRYALSHFPLFATVVSTPEYTIDQSDTHKEFYLSNETNLLTTYPGVKGVKTGYTPEAGLCLITYLDYSGHKIIGVLLGSENRRKEMQDLLDYSLLSISIKPPPHMQL